MAEAYDQEKRQNAAWLWIDKGFTYEAVSKQTDISIGCLKKWAEEEGWSEQRRLARESDRNSIINFRKMRAAMIEKTLGSLNPQDVYAVAAIESIMQRASSKCAAYTAPVSVALIAPEQLREIKTPEQAIDALQEAVDRKVNAMMATGDIDLAKIKNVNDSLKFIDEMRQRYKPTEAQAPAKRDLDPETLQHIKDLYGIK